MKNHRNFKLEIKLSKNAKTSRVDVLLYLSMLL
nr:MAG TPA: hypothetical protein [Caudoviricetes sp.]